MLQFEPCARWLTSIACVSQVILDKNPQLKTVVNKIGSIENEYRVFQMECIAGTPDYVTEVVQHGNRFRLNFSEVSPFLSSLWILRPVYAVLQAPSQWPKLWKRFAAVSASFSPCHLHHSIAHVVANGSPWLFHPVSSAIGRSQRLTGLFSLP